MLAIFIGDLSLLVGFAVLLLPLLVTELSRPRDSLWGAVILLSGLVLVTNNDRFSGAPIVAVCSAFLLISRLGLEVGQSRWHQLSDEEKNRLASFERWTSGFSQMGATVVQLLSLLGGFINVVFRKSNPKKGQKKWVRPEASEEKNSSDPTKTNSDEKSELPKNLNKEQPQKTLEGHSPSKDP